MSANQISVRVAIVTGGGHGIGAAIATRLAADGAHTIVNYNSSADEAKSLVASIKASGGNAVAIQANVSDPDQISHLFDEAERAYGTVSLLVSNAAMRGASITAMEVDLAAYDKIFAVNARGPILCSAEFARRLCRLDPQPSGRIVNITSGQARTPMPGAALYAATKGAMESITRAFAADKHGNSWAIVIDRPILELLKIDPETQVELTTDGQTIAISPQCEADKKSRIRSARASVNNKHSKAFKKLAE